MQTSNGNLHGTVVRGGANNLSTIFEYDIVTQTLTKKYDLEETTGKFLWGINLIQTSSILGVSENTTSNFIIEIYPNPTTNNIHVNFEQYGDYSFLVYDISGK